MPALIAVYVVAPGRPWRRLRVRVLLVRPASAPEPFRLGPVQQPLPPATREAIVAAIASALVAALRPRHPVDPKGS